jgi:hypothetical protein
MPRMVQAVAVHARLPVTGHRHGHCREPMLRNRDGEDDEYEDGRGTASDAVVSLSSSSWIRVLTMVKQVLFFVWLWRWEGALPCIWVCMR